MTLSEVTPMSSAVALLEALEEHQLALEYQGIYDVGLDEPAGFEALIRWDHPTGELLGPADFLPPDMGNGIGWAVTNFVLEEALRQCASWRRDGHDVGISVNMAPGRLADEVLPDRVGDLLERHRLPPAVLTMEITEHRCGVDPPAIARALAGLSELGVRLSLDDFGTGESSLARLRHLHFDEIKIDRCFVRDAAVLPMDQNIVAFVTDLAHSMGMTVVAEGIEDQACLDTIRELGVDRVQGFFMHRPARPAAIEAGRSARNGAGLRQPSRP